MKSLIRKGLLILTLCAFLIGIERLSHTLNGGFSLAAITSSLQPRPEWNITHEASDIAETLQALKQPYHYLGKGSQSFVFLSEDKKYVIKFFKHQRWRLPSMIEALPLPEVWEQKRERWKQKKQETVSDTFGSCASAYRDFKNETGLLFVHLNKTPPINRELVVIDRIGVKHRLTLGSIEFILQRRAVRTDTYLLQLKKEGKLDEAKEAINNLIHLTITRSQKGYSDKDPHLIRNFGFIEGRAVEIDVGGYHQDPKKDVHYFYGYEIHKIERKLLPWLESHYPELATYSKNLFSEKREAFQKT